MPARSMRQPWGTMMPNFNAMRANSFFVINQGGMRNFYSITLYERGWRQDNDTWRSVVEICLKARKCEIGQVCERSNK
jgi:hypothetical protein